MNKTIFLEQKENLEIRLNKKKWVKKNTAYLGESETVYQKSKIKTNKTNYEKKDSSLNLSEDYKQNLKSISKELPDSKIVLRIININKTILSPENNKISKNEYLETVKIDSGTGKNYVESSSFAFSPGGLDFLKILNNFKHKKRENQRAIKITDEKREAVFSGRAAGTLIHEFLGHLLEADIASKNQNIFKLSNINKKILPSIITIYDIPKKDNEYDDEGLPLQKLSLIEKGVLKNFISDFFHYLLGFPSPGRGRREDFLCNPLPRQNIIAMKKGNHREKELIESIKNGVLLKNIKGGSINFNKLTYEFNVIEGFNIKNGKITHPLNNFLIKGNIITTLNNISMISDQLYTGGWQGICQKNKQLIRTGYKTPSFKINNINIEK